MREFFKYLNEDDALPALLLLLMWLGFGVLMAHHARKVEEDRAVIDVQRVIINRQIRQLKNLRFILDVATEPIDFRKQDGEKPVDNIRMK